MQVNPQYNEDVYKQLVINTRQACASIQNSKKPTNDRYILHILLNQQGTMINEVILQDLQQNHCMRDTSVRLPYDDSHKQSVTMMYLDLMKLKKFRVLTGVNTFDVRSTRTVGNFPEWSDDDLDEEDDDADLNKGSSDEEEEYTDYEQQRSTYYEREPRTSGNEEDEDME